MLKLNWRLLAQNYQSCGLNQPHHPLNPLMIRMGLVMTMRMLMTMMTMMTMMVMMTMMMMTMIDDDDNKGDDDC